MAEGQVALPFAIAAVAVGQGLGDGQPLAVGAQGAAALSPWAARMSPTFVVADRQVALPSGIGRVAAGQVGGGGEARLVMSEGGGKVALGHLDVAELVVADGKIPLPEGVGRVEGGQFGADGEALFIGGEGAGAVALGDQDVADLVVADRAVPLPGGVGRIVAGQACGDGQSAAVGGDGRGSVAWAREHVAHLVVADCDLAPPVPVGGAAAFWRRRWRARRRILRAAARDSLASRMSPRPRRAAISSRLRGCGRPFPGSGARPPGRPPSRPAGPKYGPAGGPFLASSAGLPGPCGSSRRPWSRPAGRAMLATWRAASASCRRTVWAARRWFSYSSSKAASAPAVSPAASWAKAATKPGRSALEASASLRVSSSMIAAQRGDLFVLQMLDLFQFGQALLAAPALRSRVSRSGPTARPAARRFHR